MKKMLKVVAMMLALAIAFGCVIAFAENAEEGTTEEAVIETPAATEEPEVQEPEAEEPAPEATAEPTVEATTEPTAEPTVEATTEPTVEATTEPTAEPTVEATTEPTAEPTVEVATEQTTEPTEEPSSDEDVEGVEFIEEEEAAETDDGLVTIKDAPVPLAAPELSVEIFSSLTDCVALGETIRLTSKLTGFEEIEYSLQWQYDDGEGWKDVENATEDIYEFEATLETVQYAWQLVVTF